MPPLTVFLLFASITLAFALQREKVQGEALANNTSAQDKCANRPCMNGGTCMLYHKSREGFMCFCRHGFAGFYCEASDKCARRPCKNGGTCMLKSNSRTGFTCSCPSGIVGPHCEDTTDCASNPCQNGGTCVLEGNGFSCLCLPGYSGLQCEDAGDCSNNPCGQGEICEPGRKKPKRAYFCHCSNDCHDCTKCESEMARKCEYNSTSGNKLASAYEYHCWCDQNDERKKYECSNMALAFMKRPCVLGRFCFFDGGSVEY